MRGGGGGAREGPEERVVYHLFSSFGRLNIQKRKGERREEKREKREEKKTNKMNEGNELIVSTGLVLNLEGDNQRRPDCILS